MSTAWTPVRAGATRYTDDQLLSALRRCALGGTTLSRSEYRERRHADEPSPALYERRFGTWNAALSAAGLVTVQQDPQIAGTTTLWTPELLLDAMLRCSLATDTCVLTLTLRSYEAWRADEMRERRGTHTNSPAVPSGASIRVHFGSWTIAKTRADELEH